METKFARGINTMRPVRLRLILAPVGDVRLAWCTGTAKRNRTELSLAAPPEHREYALAGVRSRWRLSTNALVGPQNVSTFPLPGIYFFDAWRIRPRLDIPLHLSAGLTAVDLTHDEEMPQEPDARHYARGSATPTAGHLDCQSGGQDRSGMCFGGKSCGTTHSSVARSRGCH